MLHTHLCWCDNAFADLAGVTFARCQWKLQKIRQLELKVIINRNTHSALIYKEKLAKRKVVKENKMQLIFV